MTGAFWRLQVRDHYRARFPELESLVHHPVDYARVVAAIGNEVL
jgi:U4/U6 small nuclear ribonucleoprotein PRP31